MDLPEVFDRNARRTRRMGIARANPSDRWLIRRMALELLDRWLDRKSEAQRVLILGHDDGVIRDAMADRGIACVFADTCGGFAQIICDEDRLPFADASFDVVFASASLDTVNDLPGALILIRRSLKPGGLFLGAMLGAGSGSLLRSTVMQPIEGGALTARAHPQIDVRGAGDLLARAGFSDPVADMDSVEARYTTTEAALADRRANGLGNVLKDRYPASKARFKQWIDHAVGNGQGFTEHFIPIYMTGSAPPSVEQS